MSVPEYNCELCIGSGEELLWQDAFCRVILVNDSDYPGFCRVIWHEHIKEMSDLKPDQQNHLMRIVFEVETALRAILRPDKINLASLGNAVPHLHWHVIPRFKADKHFPLPIWGAPQREPTGNNQDNNLLSSILKATLDQRLC